VYDLFAYTHGCCITLLDHQREVVVGLSSFASSFAYVRLRSGFCPATAIISSFLLSRADRLELSSTALPTMTLHPSHPPPPPSALPAISTFLDHHPSLPLLLLLIQTINPKQGLDFVRLSTRHPSADHLPSLVILRSSSSTLDRRAPSELYDPTFRPSPLSSRPRYPERDSCR
jgi:hypothetical protein